MHHRKSKSRKMRKSREYIEKTTSKGRPIFDKIKKLREDQVMLDNQILPTKTPGYQYIWERKKIYSDFVRSHRQVQHGLRKLKHP